MDIWHQTPAPGLVITIGFITRWLYWPLSLQFTSYTPDLAQSFPLTSMQPDHTHICQLPLDTVQRFTHSFTVLELPRLAFTVFFYESKFKWMIHFHSKGLTNFVLEEEETNVQWKRFLLKLFLDPCLCLEMWTRITKALLSDRPTNGITGTVVLLQFVSHPLITEVITSIWKCLSDGTFNIVLYEEIFL